MKYIVALKKDFVGELCTKKNAATFNYIHSWASSYFAFDLLLIQFHHIKFEISDDCHVNFRYFLKCIYLLN